MRNSHSVEREVGRVAGLWRYPVKSMAAEPLERVEVGWHGLAGDRRWGFVRAGQEHNGFPWLTIREHPELARYRPRLVDPAHPSAAEVRVQTPAGAELDIVDPALAAEFGDGVAVMKLDRGAFDTLPLALISRQTLAGLADLVGRELAIERFRPNILVDGATGAAFAEDAWVGSTIRIGGLRMRIDKRDQRCMIVNVDPVTTERDPAILRTITRARQACLGVYGSIGTPGAIAIGDRVVLEA
jgi:MOSC domain-containing protein